MPNEGYHCFGQCWTLHSYSDAMWRIYSPMCGHPCQYAVRIRSRIGCLYDSLNKNCGSTQSAFIGRVRYLTTPDLIRHVRSASHRDSRTAAGTLLVKRPAFRHEREVRLILVTGSDHTADANGLFRYPLDPHTLVSQIMLDPRLDRKEAERLGNEIKAKTGFTGPVKRSLLYAPPDPLRRTVGTSDSRSPARRLRKSS